MAIDFRYRPPTSWTAISRPGERERTLVREDGALLYGYRRGTWLTYSFDRVVEFALAGAGRPEAVEQRTEDARGAIVVTTLRYPYAELELTMFRHARSDVVCWRITIGAVDELPAALHVEVFERARSFTSGPHGASARVYAVDAAKLEWWYDAQDQAAAEWRADDAELVLISDRRLAAAQPSGFRPVAAFATLQEHAGAGAVVEGVLALPLDGGRTGTRTCRWCWAEASTTCTR
ncbi:MAG: hypothetical protein HOQ28_06020, partial [Thermoleophilia bacterium]|nr:hypothetical protein [Thermoleophilia bacterium]